MTVLLCAHVGKFSRISKYLFVGVCIGQKILKNLFCKFHKYSIFLWNMFIDHQTQVFTEYITLKFQKLTQHKMEILQSLQIKTVLIRYVRPFGDS